MSDFSLGIIVVLLLVGLSRLRRLSRTCQGLRQSLRQLEDDVRDIEDQR